MQSKDDKKILSSFQTMKILATKGKRNQVLFSKSIEHTLQCTFPKPSHTNCLKCKIHNACICFFSTFFSVCKRKVNVKIRIILKAKAIYQFSFQRREGRKHSTIFFSKGEKRFVTLLKCTNLNQKQK